MFTFAKFCRLCFKNNHFLVDYTETDYDNISYYEKLKKIFPQLVTDNCENFPTWICVLCREELDQFYTFYEKCFDTHKLLQKYSAQLLSVEKKIYTLKEENPNLNADVPSISSPPPSPLDDGDEQMFLSLPDSEFIKKETDISHIFDDDTMPLNENSTDSNISIVKNEIPLTEEDELNFKLFYKTVLQSEDTTSKTGDNFHNNDLDDNLKETQDEIKQQNISHDSSFSNNDIDQTSENNGSSSLEQLDTTKNVSPEAPEHNLEEERPQNLETNLDKTKEVSNKSVFIEKLISEVPKNKSALIEKLFSKVPKNISELKEKSKNIETVSNNTNDKEKTVNIETTSDKIKPTITVKDVSSINLAKGPEQSSEMPHNPPSSSTEESSEQSSEKPHNPPSSSTEETLVIDGEETDENSSDSSGLRLRKKRRATPISYNERSDSEDFSADDDVNDRDFQPEEDIYEADNIDLDLFSSPKRGRFTSKKTNKSNTGNKSSLNTSDRNMNLLNFTRTDKQTNLINSPAKQLESTSRSVFNSPKPTNIVTPLITKPYNVINIQSILNQPNTLLNNSSTLNIVPPFTSNVSVEKEIFSSIEYRNKFNPRDEPERNTEFIPLNSMPANTNAINVESNNSSNILSPLDDTNVFDVEGTNSQISKDFLSTDFTSTCRNSPQNQLQTSTNIDLESNNSSIETTISPPLDPIFLDTEKQISYDREKISNTKIVTSYRNKLKIKMNPKSKSENKQLHSTVSAPKIINPQNTANLENDNSSSPSLVNMLFEDTENTDPEIITPDRYEVQAGSNPRIESEPNVITPNIISSNQDIGVRSFPTDNQINENTRPLVTNVEFVDVGNLNPDPEIVTGRRNELQARLKPRIEPKQNRMFPNLISNSNIIDLENTDSSSNQANINTNISSYRLVSNLEFVNVGNTNSLQEIITARRNEVQARFNPRIEPKQNTVFPNFISSNSNIIDLENTNSRSNQVNINTNNSSRPLILNLEIVHVGNTNSGREIITSRRNEVQARLKPRIGPRQKSSSNQTNHQANRITNISSRPLVSNREFVDVGNSNHALKITTARRNEILATLNPRIEPKQNTGFPNLLPANPNIIDLENTSSSSTQTDNQANKNTNISSRSLVSNQEFVDVENSNPALKIITARRNEILSRLHPRIEPNQNIIPANPNIIDLENTTGSSIQTDNQANKNTDIFSRPLVSNQEFVDGGDSNPALNIITARRNEILARSNLQIEPRQNAVFPNLISSNSNIIDLENTNSSSVETDNQVNKNINIAPRALVSNLEVVDVGNTNSDLEIITAHRNEEQARLNPLIESRQETVIQNVISSNPNIINLENTPCGSIQTDNQANINTDICSRPLVLKNKNLNIANTNPDPKIIYAQKNKFQTRLYPRIEPKKNIVFPNKVSSNSQYTNKDFIDLEINKIYRNYLLDCQIDDTSNIPSTLISNETTADLDNTDNQVSSNKNLSLAVPPNRISSNLESADVVENTDNQNLNEKSKENFVNTGIISTFKNKLQTKLNPTIESANIEKISPAVPSNIVSANVIADLEKTDNQALNEKSKENFVNTDIISTFKNKLQTKLNPTIEPVNVEKISPGVPSNIVSSNLESENIITVDLENTDNQTLNEKSKENFVNTGIISSFKNKLQTKLNPTIESANTEKISPAVPSNIVSANVITEDLEKTDNQTLNEKSKENFLNTTIISRKDNFLSIEYGNKFNPRVESENTEIISLSSMSVNTNVINVESNNSSFQTVPQINDNNTCPLVDTNIIDVESTNNKVSKYFSNTDIISTCKNSLHNKLNTSIESQSKHLSISTFKSKLQTKLNPTNESTNIEKISPVEPSNILSSNSDSEDVITIDLENSDNETLNERIEENLLDPGIISSFKNKLQTKLNFTTQSDKIKNHIPNKKREEFSLSTKIIYTYKNKLQTKLDSYIKKIDPAVPSNIISSNLESSNVVTKDLENTDNQVSNEKNVLSTGMFSSLKNKLQTKLNPAVESLKNTQCTSASITDITDLESNCNSNQTDNQTNSSLVSNENTIELENTKNDNARTSDLNIETDTNKQLNLAEPSNNIDELFFEPWPSTNHESTDDEDDDDYYSEKNCCKYCNKSHKTEEDLKHHMEKHKRRIIDCIVCYSKFPYKKNLMEHYNTAHPDITTCPVCDKKFDKHKFSAAHMCRHHGIDVLNCPKCDQLFLFAKKLYFHLQDIHKDTTFKCFRCGKSHATPAKAYKHMLSVHGSYGTFLCHICGKKFFTSKNLDSHIKLKHGKHEKRVCQYCGKQYSQKESLLLHIRSTHDIRGTFKCDICSKEFITSTRLYCHKKIHNESKKRFECKTCKKKFLHKMMLINHERIHTGEKPFKCKICDKAFSQEFSVVVHMRTHTGHKPFKCNICGNRYTQSYVYKMHLKTHNTDKDAKEESDSSESSD